MREVGTEFLKEEKRFFFKKKKTERKKDTEGNMEDVVLFVQDLKSSCGISYCRICHEGEFENSMSLETPCACSGTVKVKKQSSSKLCLLVGFDPSFLNFDELFGFFFAFFSLHTEIAYRGGATRRATQLVKYASRYEV